MLSPQTSAVTLSLDGRVALITGGSRGIGAATVRLFRKAGAKVIFSYRSAATQAEALVQECGGPEHCHAIKQELASADDGQALVHAAREIYGRLDCLIVNHGIWPSHDAPIAEMTTTQWRETMGINLDSSFGLVQAAVAQMKAQPQTGTTRGHVVLVSSTAAQRGEAFHADYAASKGALVSLTKSLSSELAGQGIYCNCVAPGWVATEMSAAALNHPETSKKVMNTIPLGRVAHVDEIAGPILFLCTPLAGFISGEIFNVNGGAVLVG
ncbi:SDR family NAD(P)-dependent oxidoreductase [Granulicella arctica]|uniref:SDR family NAD(P)-dependent oxidoreductase n=1 Tax=Granulicella arctica TaxID=940613 RepID=UPI0021E045DE|nr:SDR family oxidoreductase [Granulicella arctica]